MDKSKSIILILFLLVIFGIAFYAFDINVISLVFAEDAKDNSLQNSVFLIQSFLQAIYILLWPLLLLAGSSMSNDFVYGTIFKLDTSLWQLWNIMKNFANYALGFIFVFSILASFVSMGSGKMDKYNPKKILPKLFLATISIQASWFLIGALIDVSTILTLSLGALPLNVIKSNNDVLNKPIFMPSVYLKFNDTETQNPTKTTTLYKIGNVALGSCIFSGGELAVEETKEVVNRQKNSAPTSFQQTLNPELCIAHSSVFKLSDPQNPVSLSEFAKTSTDKSLTLSNIISKSKGMTGPMFTLYASLLNIADLPVGGNGGSVSLNTVGYQSIIKLFMAIALFLPLFTLGLVLVVRGMMLWLVIIASPFLFLSWVLGWKAKSLDKLDIGSVLGLIFMPAVATFSISICIVFMHLLIHSISPNEKAVEDRKTNIGIVQEPVSVNGTIGGGNSSVQTTSKYKISDMYTMQFITPKENYSFSPLLDTLGYFVTNIFGIIFMWTIIFASLKTSKLTSGIVNFTQQLGEGLVGAAPIIPTPAGAVGLSALSKAATSIANKPNLQAQSQYENSTLKKGIDDLFKTRSSSGSVSNVSDLKNLRETSKLDSFEKVNTDTKYIEGLKNIANKYGYSPTWKNVDEALHDPKFNAILSSQGITSDKWYEYFGGVQKDKKESDEKLLEKTYKEFVTSINANAKSMNPHDIENGQILIDNDKQLLFVEKDKKIENIFMLDKPEFMSSLAKYIKEKITNSDTQKKVIDHIIHNFKGETEKLKSALKNEGLNIS